MKCQMVKGSFIHSGNHIQKFRGLYSIGHCYIWPGLFKYSVGCKMQTRIYLKLFVLHNFYTCNHLKKNSLVVLLLIYWDCHITISSLFSDISAGIFIELSSGSFHSIYLLISSFSSKYWV